MNADRIVALAFAGMMLGTVQAHALSSWFPPGPGGPGKPPHSHSAAGPVAGVGIPLALMVGGYIWYRNRPKK